MRNGRTAMVIACWFVVMAEPIWAQDNQVQALKEQLRLLQEGLERTHQEYRRQIEDLTRKLEAIEGRQDTAPEQQKLEQELAAEMKNSGPGQEAVAATKPAWSPADPIQLRSGSSYIDIGLVGTFAVGSSTAEDIAGSLEPGGHDPNQRGFTVQGVEATLSGAVDPYFKGNVNLLYQLDADGESIFELEEAWLQTLSLPWGLQVRAGQIYTEFGRQNSLHPHAWAAVDQPLVLASFMGPDGLRNPGARVSWLTPTPFFSELMLSVQDSHGETAAGFRSEGGHGHGGEDELPFAYRHADNDRGVHSVDDLLLAPRYALSLDLTENQVVLVGGSAAFGPNSRGGSDAGDTVTRIYGVDATWKWKSPSHHAGFPFVSIQGEGLLRQYEAGAFDWDENGNESADFGEVVDMRTGRPAFLDGETLTDYGFYTQVLYGFRKGWVAGLRYDWLSGNPGDYEAGWLSLDGEPLGRDPQRARRWRLSPSLTWYPTEFSKLRLQYNYDDRSEIGVDHSLWLQLEFLLGAHAAHKF